MHGDIEVDGVRHVCAVQGGGRSGDAGGAAKAGTGGGGGGLADYRIQSDATAVATGEKGGAPDGQRRGEDDVAHAGNRGIRGETEAAEGIQLLADEVVAAASRARGHSGAGGWGSD